MGHYTRKCGWLRWQSEGGGQKGRTVCKSVPAQQALRPCTSRPGDAKSILLITHHHSSNCMEELNACRVLLLAEAMYPS